MRIGIDMLGIQSAESRGRGIGRYGRSLLAALLDAGAGHEFVLYAHDELPTERFPRAPNATLRRLDPGPTAGASVAADRADDDPDRLDALLILSPLELHRDYDPPPRPLDGPRDGRGRLRPDPVPVPGALPDVSPGRRCGSTATWSGCGTTTPCSASPRRPRRWPPPARPLARACRRHRRRERPGVLRARPIRASAPGLARGTATGSASTARSCSAWPAPTSEESRWPARRVRPAARRTKADPPYRRRPAPSPAPRPTRCVVAPRREAWPIASS